MSRSWCLIFWPYFLFTNKWLLQIKTHPRPPLCRLYWMANRGQCVGGSAGLVNCPASPGSYCPPGSAAPTLCPAGFYCSGGSADAAPCQCAKKFPQPNMFSSPNDARTQIVSSESSVFYSLKIYPSLFAPTSSSCFCEFSSCRLDLFLSELHLCCNLINEIRIKSCRRKQGISGLLLPARHTKHGASDASESLCFVNHKIIYLSENLIHRNPTFLH